MYEEKYCGEFALWDIKMYNKVTKIKALKKRYKK